MVILRNSILLLLSVGTIFIIVHTQDPNVERSFLRINQPKSLIDSFPNGVEEQPAMFGIPAYSHGASITGLIVYPQTEDHEGCFAIDRSHSAKPWPETGIVIVLVDRGNCTFVTKVRHAEAIGANAAIIVDNIDEWYLPYMANDGTGDSITIPSMLIRKRDGQLIKDAAVNGMVVVTMSWNLPHPDNRVEWEFWTSSNDHVSLDFKRDFREAVQLLGDHALFQPHYYLVGGWRRGCGSYSLPCSNQCTNSGRYCAVDPEHDLSSGLSGAHVVRENLRQMCLWRHLNQTGNTLKWWDYVIKFHDVCARNKEDTWLPSCSQARMRELDIDVDAVNDCVIKSGGTGTYDGENSLLTAELDLKRDTGIFFLPTIIINGVHYRGSLSCPPPADVGTCGILTTICAGYKYGTEPSICRGSPGCKNGTVRDMCGVCGGNGKFDGCKQCLDPNDARFRLHGERDVCGVCLNPGEEDWNQLCSGCDGIPNSGLINDTCGICNGTGKDICGTCAQGSKRITKEIGGWDQCGQCLRFGSNEWDKPCKGCDGIPNSGKVIDDCNVCGGPGKDVCGRCLPIDSPHRITSLTGGWDKCGSCLKYNDPMWGKLCCENEVMRDACGNCFPDDDPRRIDEVDKCNGKADEGVSSSEDLSVGLIIFIVIASIVVAGSFVFFIMRRRERRVRHDLDLLLKRYLPLANKGGYNPPAVTLSDIDITDARIEEI